MKTFRGKRSTRRRRALRFNPGDERGSLAMLLMVTVVGLALSGMLIPIVVGQDRGTLFDKTRVHALDAAQAGIDVSLGRIRAAIDPSTGIGDSAKLPCGPVSGKVNGTGPSYTVTIDYFTIDPTQNPSAPRMTCAEHYGTYYAGPPVAFTPSFARLTSVGTDGTAVNGASKGRTLISTYVLKTSNTNIAGGVIRIYPASSDADLDQLCIDAGDDNPAAGTVVTMQVCSTTTPPIADQVFIYRSDLTIQQLSSITTTYPNGLCLDTAAPPTAGNTVKLNACSPLNSPPYTQQWSFNDWGAYQTGLPNSKNDGVLGPPNLCMNVASQTEGLQVNLATCVNSTTSATQAWIPQPSVGAGAAVAPQWVNYLEFGRCLDVTNQNVNSDHLIDYPCKQNPFAGAVAWNQKFAMPTIAANQSSATGHVVTTKSGVDYCLTKPATGLYVTVSPCGTSVSQNWTVYDGDNTLRTRPSTRSTTTPGLSAWGSLHRSAPRCGRRSMSRHAPAASSRSGTR